jgi:hypothetical protein
MWELVGPTEVWWSEMKVLQELVSPVDRKFWLPQKRVDVFRAIDRLLGILGRLHGRRLDLRELGRLVDSIRDVKVKLSIANEATGKNWVLPPSAAERDGYLALPGGLEVKKVGASDASPLAKNPSNSTPSSFLSATNAEADLSQLALACGGEEAVRILAIARDHDKSADQRQREISTIDNRFFGYKSADWATLLGITDSMARSTNWWKEDRAQFVHKD